MDLLGFTKDKLRGLQVRLSSYFEYTPYISRISPQASKGEFSPNTNLLRPYSLDDYHSVKTSAILDCYSIQNGSNLASSSSVG